MISLIVRLTLIIVFSNAAFALPPTPAPAQSAPMMIQGVVIHVGNGEVIEGGAVTFEQGRITGIYQADETPELPDHNVIQLNGEHLYPGFILPNTWVGLSEINSVRASRDDRETGGLNPSVRSIVAYNADSELLPTYRFNGVLTAQVTPRGSLLAGMSAIVQLDAWNWEDAAVKADDGMHLYWPRQFKSKPDYLRRTVEWELNKDYSEQVQSLVDLFADAAATTTDNLKLLAVKPILNGNQTLFVHAKKAKEIGDALKFAEQYAINIVLVGADEALKVKDMVLARNVPVIVQFVHGRPAQDDGAIDENFTRPARFIAAGFKVGLSSQSRMAPYSGRNLPFMAGTAAGFGLTPEQALSLITLNNAEILGVADELGSIEIGKHATLFVSKGDALDMRTNQISVAFIYGRQVTIRGTQQELYDRFHEKYAGDN
jgi:imidazolonepropionase-like amidohydrolase